MKKYVVSEETTLKKFTDNVCAQASFYWSALCRKKDIRVNGVKTGGDMPLFVGDEVCYYLTPAQEARRAFTVVYEDGEVLVADKESGVNSEAVFSELCERGEYYFIHRLDRNTAGLMIFGRTKAAEKALLDAFKNRKVQKIYEALVVGRLPKKRDVLTAYLKKNEKTSTVFLSDRPVGEKVITEYESLSFDGECSLVRITLHTGKTHQIRAHMAYIGHPVVGDEKYGDGAFNRAHKVTRQRLVAKKLTLLSEELPEIQGKSFVSRFEANG